LRDGNLAVAPSVARVRRLIELNRSAMSTWWGGRGVFAVALLLGMFASAPASAAMMAAPAWAPIAVSGPTNLPPGGQGTIAVYLQNVGGAPSTGTIVVEDRLPPGLTVSAAAAGEDWQCSSPGSDAIACTTAQPVAPGTIANPIGIPVNVAAATPEPEVNLLTASGGGAASPATYEEPVTISATPAKPGVQVFTAGFYEADGAADTQAGSHPYTATSAVFVNTVATPDGQVVLPADARTLAFGLPPGFLGNPTAVPGCREGLEDSECPLESQVGIAEPITGFGAGSDPSAVHSVEAPVGYPAKFTFTAAGLLQVDLVAGLRSDDDYGTTAEAPNIPPIEPLYGAFFTLWGTPADPGHDELRCEDSGSKAGCGPSAASNAAFITQPTGCALQAAQPPLARLSFDTWLTSGESEHRQFPIPSVNGCEQLAFGADFSLEPNATESDSPVAFEGRLTSPSEGLIDPSKLIAPEIKTAVIELPKGVVLNPSAAEGLGACSEQQIGLLNEKLPSGEVELLPEPNRIRFDRNPNRCPDSAKIGSVEVKTALLEDPLHGDLFLAAQGDGNPFGSLFALYLVIEDPGVGIVIKLPGEVAVDEQTGQMTATFEDLPQIPFTPLQLDLKGGSRSPLATPSICGKFVTAATSTPWSAPESGPPVISEDSLTIDSGPGGSACANTPRDRPFDLGLRAGVANATAGAHSPFDLGIARPDGAQELDSLQIGPPPGFVASLRGVPYCTEAEIEAARMSTATAEGANPACPSVSQVGTTETGAGSGPTPFYTAGKLYLAGPYRGAPLSVAAITPGIAGPFDLGNLVIRSALYVDPSSARITVKTDPIPRFLDGVALRIRDLRINLDRPSWALNPTSCEAKAVDVTAHGNSGAVARLSRRFQVGGCGALPFKPKLRLGLTGATARNGHPALTATLTQAAGQANVGSLSLTLPRSELLAQSHIRAVCTRSRFAEHACPARSIYGHAEAVTPLTDQPLRGPVYLRASDHKLPDLVLALRGPASQPIEIDLVGRVDSVNGRIRNSFEAIPDAPIGKLVLRMYGGRRGLLANSRDLCAKPSRATVRLVGQNNKRADRFPVVQSQCGKATRRPSTFSGVASIASASADVDELLDHFDRGRSLEQAHTTPAHLHR